MASILETFYIMFKSNSSELKKGTHEAKESTDKLKDSLKRAHEFSEKLGDKFLELASIFSEALLSFTSAEAVLENLKQTQEYTNQLFELGEQLNVSSEELDAWGNAVKETGGNLQSLSSTLRGLDRNLAQNSLRGPNQFTALLARVGVSVRDANGHIRDSLSLLPELASVFQRLGKTQSKEFGIELGLDPATILLLQKGRAEVEKAVQKQRELGVATEESTKISHEFSDEWNNTANAFRKVFELANDKVLPVFTEFLKKLQEVAVFMQKHPVELATALGAIAGIIVGALVPAIGLLLPLIVGVIGAISPWMIVFAAVGAAIGFFYDKIQGSEILEFFHKRLQKIEHRIGVLIELAKEVGHAFSEAADYVTEKWEKVVNAVDKVVNKFENAKNKFKSYFGAGTLDVEAGQQAIAQSANAPIASQSSSILNSFQNSQKSNKIYTGPITIQTQATDANGIASDFVSVLNDHYRQAINQHNDGVVI